MLNQKDVNKKNKKVRVSSDCIIAQAVKNICSGVNGNSLRKLLEELKIKNTNKIEISHIKDKIYYVKSKNKEGLVEIPEIITMLGFIIMTEYLAKNPNLCIECSLFKNKDVCPRYLFI